MKVQYDCIIVGSGPAGCSAAVYLGMSGLTSCLIKGPTPGGLLTKTHRVDNYLGLYGNSGMEITENFMDHASKFTTMIDDSVINIVGNDEYVSVQCESCHITGKYAIIACGSNPKKLNVPNETLGGISYCAICDGFFYKNSEVCVIGGGNSAFEEAIYMSKIARKVYLIHRSSQFKAFQSNIDRVKSIENIEIKTNTIVREFNGNNSELNSVTIMENNQENTLNIQGAFIAIGYEASLEFVKNVKKIDGYLAVNNHYCSSNKRIYGCGDCIVNNNLVRYKQASISAAEGCVCALEIANLI